LHRWSLRSTEFQLPQVARVLIIRTRRARVTLID
jgi:hypothetical protein